MWSLIATNCHVYHTLSFCLLLYGSTLQFIPVNFFGITGINCSTVYASNPKKFTGINYTTVYASNPKKFTGINYTTVFASRYYRYRLYIFARIVYTCNTPVNRL